MQMVMSMKEIGMTINLMVMESIYIKMGRNTRVIGKKTNNMNLV